LSVQGLMHYENKIIELKENNIINDRSSFFTKKRTVFQNKKDLDMNFKRSKKGKI